MDSIQLDKSAAESLISEIGTNKIPLVEMKAVVDQARYIQERSNKSKNKIDEIVYEAIALGKSVQKEHSRVYGLVQQLIHYVSFGGHGDGKLANLLTDVMLHETRSYLDAIKERGQYIDKRHNRGIIEFEYVFNYFC